MLETEVVRKTGSRSYFETYFNDYFTDLGANEPYQNKGYLSNGIEAFPYLVATFEKARGIAF